MSEDPAASVGEASVISSFLQLASESVILSEILEASSLAVQSPGMSVLEYSYSENLLTVPLADA